jgi:hypothetical protein
VELNLNEYPASIIKIHQWAYIGAAVGVFIFEDAS